MTSFFDLVDRVWDMWMGLFTWAPFGEAYVAGLGLLTVVCAVGYVVAHVLGYADP